MSVRINDGAGNAITSTTNALDVNIKSSGGLTATVSGTVGVNNFPVTQAVSGTVSVSNLPVTQAVSGTVSVGNFPATQPVSGTVAVSNFPATQPVSAASLPLPSGAATAAKQPALGVAGTPSTDVITVQGAATGTALPVSGTVSVSNFPASQTVSGSVSVSNLPATQTVSGSVSVSNFPASQTVSGTVTANAGTGNFTVVQATGTNLHTVVDSGTVTAVTTITNGVKVLGNGGATLDTAVLSGAAPTNAVYTVSSPTAVAAGSLTSKFINASGAAVSVKASAGNLYGFSLTNETASVAYIEFFNIATTPTLGTTAVVFAIKLPASANVTIPPSELALMNFTTGIGFAVTTTENGTTTASVTGMIFYQ